MENTYFENNYEMNDVMTAAQKEENRQRYKFISKWVWYLFILVLVANVAAIMINDTVTGLVPALKVPGQILNFFCSVCYSLVLWKLSSVEEQYKTAAILGFVTAGISALSILLSGLTILILLLTLVSLVCTLVKEYKEYMAHSAVFAGIDNDMSYKWGELWKWYLGVILGSFAATLIVLFIPIVGAILLLLAAIVSIGVGVLKIVYLYKTSKFFEGYAQN